METFNAVFFCGIEQSRCAKNVGFYEDFRIFDRAVDVAFGGEVHDDIGTFLFKQIENEVTIGDVAFDKLVVRLVFYALETFQISGVSQRVELMISSSGYVLTMYSTKLEPMNPAPPVTRIFMYG